MALPKIQHRIYEHHLTGANKTIKYRAFTVAEQKILLMAKEESQADGVEIKNGTTKQALEAVSQIVQNCTLGKIKADDICTFDLEDLFVRIRSKSVGELMTVTYAEHYKDEEGREKTNFIDVKINLDDIKVVKQEGHENKIMVTDTIGVMMKYPTFKMLKECTTSESLTIACIDSIFDEKEVYDAATSSKEELQEFYDSIEAKPLMQIAKFFETMPKLKHTVTVKLHDGTDKDIVFEGLQSFFS